MEIALMWAMTLLLLLLKISGCDSLDLFEYSGEVRLIGKSKGVGNLSDRAILLFKPMGCMINVAFQHVLEGY
ncbi:hypothetical protein PN498_25020 [Oscillatoria sp. CS-180]|uniref:hypothetical protein n=1 Tax=Oscillatoria sp. CS-180 TaxID=3021720 RepID=UPI00232F07D2|nr:hypothetical protein [Oscillatoria sp. CS-180]MDB9529279.1 hypothetical protein [Oscillatoria sp. CS-180]